MEKQLLGFMTVVFSAFFSMSAISLAKDTAPDALSKKEKTIIPIAAFTAGGNIPCGNFRASECFHRDLDGTCQ